jgi:hypothetical protein
MSAEKLLQYLEDHYEKLDREDTNMNKINCAIYARICSIIEEFNRKIYMEKAEYTWKACGEKDTPEKIYEKMRAVQYYNYPHHIFKVSYAYENNLRFVVLTTDAKSAEKVQSRKFLDSVFDEEKLKEIDMKRLKNDARAFLSEFVKFRERVQKLVHM